MRAKDKDAAKSPPSAPRVQRVGPRHFTGSAPGDEALFGFLGKIGALGGEAKKEFETREKEMKTGDHIILRPTPQAQGRTKNRLREHGEVGFIVQRLSTSVGCLKHRPALLLESVSKTSAGGESWHGWLPCEEVEVEIRD
jgi:hypothetical protein